MLKQPGGGLRKKKNKKQTCLIKANHKKKNKTKLKKF